MEADRMVNLRLSDPEVATERQVIIEERRVRTENVPSSILTEQMSAALYQNHPYRIPIIGWMHEMAKLSREDALTFYKRFYAPNNAIVVVTGDVNPAEVKALAEATYGALPANPQVGAPRVRPQEPEQRAARRVELKDPRAGNASVRRYYLAPALTKAAPGEAEALYLLMKIAGLGGTSRIYQKLVVEEKIASSAGGWYSGLSLDSGSIGLYAVAAEGVALDKVEQGIDRVVHDLRENGVTEAELERAKKQFLAEFVYESDSQEQLARRYGSGLALGMTIDQINSWPAAIAKVTVAQVKEAAAKYLDIRRSVTGTLVPAARDPRTSPRLQRRPKRVEGRTVMVFQPFSHRARASTRVGNWAMPWLLVLALAAALTTLTPGRALAMKIQEIKSPGGITAWLVEEHSVPLIAMRFAFEGGSAQDPAGKEGLANFLGRHAR